MKLITIHAILVSSLLAASASAQSVATGHRLYSPRSGTDTFLLDRTGTTVHTWASAYKAGNTVWMMEDGRLLRAIKTDNVAPGSSFGGAGGGVEILDFEGNQLWEYRYDSGGVYAHHDVEELPNGNILLLAWEEIPIAQAIAAGRNPATITGNAMFPDHIIEVEPTGPTTGDIAWEWHVWDHLIQDHDAGQANHGVVADHPELVDVNYPPTRNAGDWNHCNSIDYDPVNDLILISSNFQEEIWIIDHSTTTAEAAGSIGGNYGKGGDLLYRWGNPEAYGRGTPADKQLFIQHAARFIPAGRPEAGNVVLFNNQVPGGSVAIELELPPSFALAPGATWGPVAPTWDYSDGANFQSNIMSSVERLPNDNVLICSSLQGRVFEIDDAGTNLWEIAVQPGIQNVTFHVSYAERSCWASQETLSVSAGGTVDFDLRAGSEQAGVMYLLAGTLSGSTPGFPVQGFTVPLNVDSYLRYTTQMVTNPYHTNNFGALDGVGNAASTFTLPAGVQMSLIGQKLHYAYMVADLGPFQMRAVSNAVEIEFVP